MPFILIVGSFRPEQVKEILDGFLNRVIFILIKKKKKKSLTFFLIGNDRSAFKRYIPGY
jgi:hypothetical protein